MHKTGKRLLIIFFAILLLGGGLLVYQHTSSGSSGSESKKETAQQRAQDSQKKAETIDASKGSSQGAYNPPANSNGIELTIAQPSAEQVVVTTKLIGYSDGICSLTATNGNKTNTQSARVIYQPEFSTCAGFTIPVTSLGTGNWTLNLSISAGGVTNQKTTTVKVK
jgi:hypothetical protein